MPTFGRQKIDTENSEFNALMFVIQQMLATVNVATLVQVVNAYPGGTGVAGTVDVLPLVQQSAGDGTAVPHTTIYGVPYLRIQGGTNAIVCDPQPGDIGFCVFADSDFTNVQSTCAPALPASARKFDYADGLYLGGWNGATAPVNYVQIDGTGVTVNSQALTKIISQAMLKVTTPIATFSGNLTVSGAASGSFTTQSGSVVTVQDGIITNIM